ncbi:hypothetical protein FJW07_26130 [Mesorhizobium sp. B3-1-9]|nr:hypothetical protein FJW07_26130 [Mesorhizobium sp. B3-1-9]
MSRKSVQRFCDNDMHENKALKRRVNPLQRDALLGGFAVAVRPELRQNGEGALCRRGALNLLFTIKSDPVLPADDAPETHPRPRRDLGRLK